MGMIGSIHLLFRQNHLGTGPKFSPGVDDDRNLETVGGGAGEAGAGIIIDKGEMTGILKKIASDGIFIRECGGIDPRRTDSFVHVDNFFHFFFHQKGGLQLLARQMGIFDGIGHLRCQAGRHDGRRDNADEQFDERHAALARKSLGAAVVVFWFIHGAPSTQHRCCFQCEQCQWSM